LSGRGANYSSGGFRPSLAGYALKCEQALIQKRLEQVHNAKDRKRNDCQRKTLDENLILPQFQFG